MILMVAASVAAGILAPHLVALRRASPVVAEVLWGCSLALRALVGLAAAIYVVFLLPATGLFGALTSWCLHAALPMATTHLGLNGHRLGDAAVLLPGLLLVASLGWAAYGLARAARKIGRVIRAGRLGRGPEGSVVVGGPGVLLAVAGLTRPTLVVSTGALTQLDDDELAAGLDHERGHIARRHHYVLVVAHLSLALGWIVPGGRRGLEELRFHLERDADRWALNHRHDRLALASAICKAASSRRPPASAAFASLAGGWVTERLDQITGATAAPDRRTTVTLNVAATAAVLLTVALTAALPVGAYAAARSPQGVERHVSCPT